jgi:hypothetical protein
MTFGHSNVTHHTPVTAYTACSVRFIVYPYVIVKVPKFLRDLSRHIFAFHQLLFVVHVFLAWENLQLFIVIDKELDVRLMSFLCVTPVSAGTMCFEQSRQIAGMKSGPVMPV